MKALFENIPDKNYAHYSTKVFLEQVLSSELPFEQKKTVIREQIVEMTKIIRDSAFEVKGDQDYYFLDYAHEKVLYTRVLKLLEKIIYWAKHLIKDSENMPPTFGRIKEWVDEILSLIENSSVALIANRLRGELKKIHTVADYCGVLYDYFWKISNMENTASRLKDVSGSNIDTSVARLFKNQSPAFIKTCKACVERKWLSIAGDKIILKKVASKKKPMSIRDLVLWVGLELSRNEDYYKFINQYKSEVKKFIIDIFYYDVEGALFSEKTIINSTLELEKYKNKKNADEFLRVLSDSGYELGCILE